MTIRLRIPLLLEQTLAWLSRLLAGAGVVGVGAFLWSRADSYLYQQANAVPDHAPAEVIEQASDAPVAQAPLPRRSRFLKPDPLALGHIEIPRLGIRATIREGVDTSSLRRAVGHVTHTPLPGSPGNAVIAGHRDTGFRALRGVERGDRIRLDVRGATMEFVVDKLMIVGPDAVDVMDPTPGETRLTLITCYPFDYIGAAQRRLIVGARALTGDGGG